MSIVCISRGSFLGAKKLAEEVADRLQIPCISRELAIQAAAGLGLKESDVNEIETRPPMFLERFSRERESRLLFVRSQLLAEAVKGAFSYHGNAAHLLIPDVPTVLRIRVVAPKHMRIKAGMKILQCGEREAEAYIRKVDRRRQQWTRYLYDVDWQDPSIYDLVFNLESIRIEEAADLVCQLASHEKYRRTPETRQAIVDLELACRVELALGVTLSSDLKVTAEGGKIQIKGHTVFSERRHEIETTATAVEGVESVELSVSSAEELVGW